MREWCWIKTFYLTWLRPSAWWFRLFTAWPQGSAAVFSGHQWNFDNREIHKGVTVEVMRCAKCGAADISWREGERNG